MRLVIFGVGANWKVIKDYIDICEHEIVAFLDNYYKGEVKWGDKGVVEVISPGDFFADKVMYDVILITGIHYKDIKEQLIGKYRVSVNQIACVEEECPLSKQIIKAAYFKEKKRDRDLERIKRDQRNSLHLQAKLLINNLAQKDNIDSIHEVEFRVNSQWGEDGIIQWLIHHIPIKNKTFIEFGVENYEEANTRFLLENDNWSGMIMDGSSDNIDYVKRSELYWRYDLCAIDAFITKENINQLLRSSGFDEDLGLLSVDIDGNDFWVLKEINCMKPRILICEYNSIYGEKEKVTIPYKADFYRTEAHYSNLYFGASLEAIKLLAGEKGYTFVGANSNGCNAFFVRNDLANFLPEKMLLNAGYVLSKFRESRNKNGELTYMSHNKAKKVIGEMDVFDITTETIKKIHNLEK